MAAELIRKSIFNAAAGMTMLVTGFICSIITARLLGPEANGMVAFAFWLTTTGTMIAGLGSDVHLPRILPQLKARGFDERHRRAFSAFIAQFVLIAVLVLLLAYGGLTYATTGTAYTIGPSSIDLVTGVLFLLQAIGALTVNYLIGEQRPDFFFKLTIIASLLQLVVTVIGAMYYGAAGALAGYIASYGIFFLYALRTFAVRPDACGWSTSELLRASVTISLGTIIESVFLNRIELAFLQQFQGIHTVGFYAIGLTLANLALQLPVQLAGTLVPYYTELAHKHEGRRLPVHLFEDVIRIMAYITLPLGFGLAAISTELVTNIFGADFGPAGSVVALLALSAPLSVFTQVSTKYIYAIGKERARLNIGIIGAIVISLGCLALVPFYGGEGAAIARLIMLFAISLLMIRQMEFEGSLADMFISLVKITAASAVCAGAAHVVVRSMEGPQGTVLAILAGALAYFVMLALTRAVPRADAEGLAAMSARLPAVIGKPVAAFARVIGSGDRPAAIQADIPMTLPARPAVRAELAESRTAIPVVFGSCTGFFKPAAFAGTDQAVLFVSPWGFEELSVRKFWRSLAEDFARDGLASLRFDLPGTGNALDADPEAGLRLWQDALAEAASELRRLSGTGHILIVAQGLGAALAASTAERLGPLSGIAMLAPVVSGRAYLRELAVWARITDGKPDPEKELHEGHGFWISGLRLPDRIYEELRRLDLKTLLPLPVSHLFVAARPDRPAEVELARQAAASDMAVTQVPYDGYDRLVGNLNFSEQPQAVMQALVDWARDRVQEPLTGRPGKLEPNPRLAGAGFMEYPVLIGPDGRLAATLCMPADGERKGATVILLSTAYHPSAGWGRIGAGSARRLAREGIASLRFDSANTSDSPPLAGAPEQILYSPAQKLDVTAALDFIEQQHLMPAIIGGRCSGGYLAFRSLLNEQRLSGAVSGNPYVFQWNDSRKVEDLLRFVPKPLGNYGPMLFRGSTWKRMWTGEIAVKHAVINMTGQIAGRMLHASETLLRLFPWLSREYRDVHGAFAELEARKVPLSLLYADDDPGIAHLNQHFGEGGRRITRFRNVSLRFLSDTDHNLSTPEAREVFVNEVLAMASRFQPQA